MEILPLVCVFLLTRCGTTSADGTGPVVIKMVVNEGNDAILPCSLDTRSIKQELFDWKKDGDKEVFMYDKGSHYNKDRTGQDEQFKGRVFHFPEHLESGNASIVIRHTKVTDSGNYTCDFPFHLPNRRSHIVLVVDPILKDRSDENIPGAAQEPSVTNLDQTSDWALLRCVVRGASPKPRVQWQDRAGNIVPAEKPQVSERGGIYDIVLNTTVTKTDHYRCVSTQDEINHQTHAEIFVHFNGAAPKPSITTLGETKDGVQLQCEVHGASPKPRVQWQDRDGNIVPAEEPQVSERRGSYDIVLQTTVTKTDYYRCVSTQDEINHQTHAETYVPVHGRRKPPTRRHRFRSQTQQERSRRQHVDSLKSRRRDRDSNVHWSQKEDDAPASPSSTTENKTTTCDL
ncbi:CD276 antigen isoform X1 [Scophthalmus maximus]|uniref:CD276 antigen isoform X1 n=1 Tax=Scophthalmus maximus TaxID=52904 RepID=UPI001FA93242|nr:CD276 antigen isoform X1 [Scophthalmus maximus]